ESEPAGLQCRRNQHVRAREVRVGLAAPVAMAAVVTGLPAVQRLCDDRQPSRNARDVQFIARLLDEKLVAARLWCGLEDAIGIVAQSFTAAEDPDESIEPIVVF